LIGREIELDECWTAAIEALTLTGAAAWQDGLRSRSRAVCRRTTATGLVAESRRYPDAKSCGHHRAALGSRKATEVLPTNRRRARRQRLVWCSTTASTSSIGRAIAGPLLHAIAGLHVLATSRGRSARKGEAGCRLSESARRTRTPSRRPLRAV